MHEAAKPIPVKYLHLAPDDPLPEVPNPLPSRVVVIVEAEGSAQWQAATSDWLVASGCLYMMAWGLGCSSWDDSVDWALLGAFRFEDIPPERFVMTSWHENETLDDVFFFCKQCALHDSVNLAQTVLLHIAKQPAEQRIMDVYAQA